MIKIAVIGSRTGIPEELVSEELDKLKKNYQIEKIISGGARGVDEDAEHWCSRKGVLIEIIRPLNPEDKISYLFRNIEIITKADMIAAFWDGKSRGTKFTIDYAVKRQMNIIIHRVKESGK